MSLMQVVGASFANVGLSQANPLLSQLNIPVSRSTTAVPPDNQTPAAPSSSHHLQVGQNTQDFTDVELQPASKKAQPESRVCEEITDSQLNPEVSTTFDTSQ